MGAQSGNRYRRESRLTRSPRILPGKCGKSWESVGGVAQAFYECNSVVSNEMMIPPARLIAEIGGQPVGGADWVGCASQQLTTTLQPVKHQAGQNPGRFCSET